MANGGAKVFDGKKNKPPVASEGIEKIQGKVQTIEVGIAMKKIFGRRIFQNIWHPQGHSAEK